MNKVHLHCVSLIGLFWVYCVKIPKLFILHLFIYWHTCFEFICHVSLLTSTPRNSYSSLPCVLTYSTTQKQWINPHKGVLHGEKSSSVNCMHKQISSRKLIEWKKKSQRCNTSMLPYSLFHNGNMVCNVIIAEASQCDYKLWYHNTSCNK